MNQKRRKKAKAKKVNGSGFRKSLCKEVARLTDRPPSTAQHRQAQKEQAQRWLEGAVSILFFVAALVALPIAPANCVLLHGHRGQSMSYTGMLFTSFLHAGLEWRFYLYFLSLLP